ncbi:MupG family TIM beta-alpha barrel fold protein [Williamsoniiplasma lucivorax]|uniref:Outer surface protein n=1 Tax=Williamsoniiplasma lucivorax TaxID=209274 RepID=A0A2S5REL7_9MOLU|nr:MupG family TIM beta-alpha barrel fold protein [Williamsoniiplasma lucivorax]PPE05766.1 hypothetical protein ELUCI_v1c00540 [Williamsoniiplasma lucivorax]
MEARKKGISIYPEQATLEDTYKYLAKAKKLGFELLFVSFVQITKKEDLEKIKSAIKYAKELNYIVYADVWQGTLDLVGATVHDMGNLVKMGIDVIRFDYPLSARELAHLTHNKDGYKVQLNMSNNDHLIHNVMDFKPILTRVEGGHNFYPQKDTGLTLSFLKECNQKYLNYNFPISAFVGSHFGEQGPKLGLKALPTLEVCRELPISTQAKMLFFTDEVNYVFIGNAFATDQELEEFSKIDPDRKSFKINLKTTLSKPEKEILYWDVHSRRMDITPFFIRSVFSRYVWRNASIEPKNSVKVFNRGDVIIKNNNAGEYKGELHIILEDRYENRNNEGNLIGSIVSEELCLLDYIDAATYFVFEKE